MAKGDMGGGGNSAQQPPKTDQYSVMHKLMDAFGSPNTSIAPTQMPSMGGQANFDPQMGGRFNTGNNFLAGDQFGNNGMQPTGGGSFQKPSLPGMSNNWGITGGAGSIAPSNPQDMMRRTMIDKGIFGQ